LKPCNGEPFLHSSISLDSHRSTQHPIAEISYSPALIQGKSIPTMSESKSTINNSAAVTKCVARDIGFEAQASPRGIDLQSSITVNSISVQSRPSVSAVLSSCDSLNRGVTADSTSSHIRGAYSISAAPKLPRPRIVSSLPSIKGVSYSSKVQSEAIVSPESRAASSGNSEEADNSIASRSKKQSPSLSRLSEALPELLISKCNTAPSNPAVICVRNPTASNLVHSSFDLIGSHDAPLTSDQHDEPSVIDTDDSNLSQQHPSPRVPSTTPRFEPDAKSALLKIVENFGGDRLCSNRTLADTTVHDLKEALIFHKQLLPHSSGITSPFSQPDAHVQSSRLEDAAVLKHRGFDCKVSSSAPWFVQYEPMHPSSGSCCIKRQSTLSLERAQPNTSQHSSFNASDTDDRLRADSAAAVLQHSVTKSSSADDLQGIHSQSAVASSSQCSMDLDNVGSYDSAAANHTRSSSSIAQSDPNHLKLLSNSRAHLFQHQQPLHVALKQKHHRSADVVIPQAHNLLARLHSDTGKFAEHCSPLHIKGQKRNDRRHQRVLLGADPIRAQKLEI
jgi:hypothetical protein